LVIVRGQQGARIRFRHQVTGFAPLDDLVGEQLAQVDAVVHASILNQEPRRGVTASAFAEPRRGSWTEWRRCPTGSSLWRDGSPHRPPAMTWSRTCHAPRSSAG